MTSIAATTTTAMKSIDDADDDEGLKHRYIANIEEVNSSEMFYHESNTYWHLKHHVLDIILLVVFLPHA